MDKKNTEIEPRCGREASDLSVLLSGTDYQVLEALVPDIRERMTKNGNQKVVQEIMKRNKRNNEQGFMPFHWMLGCL